VALLDHSYHTVLSSRSETPLNLLLMEGLVKRRWLNRPSQLQVATLPITCKSIAKLDKKDFNSYVMTSVQSFQICA
jgi:hypothetical protein